MKAIRLNEVIDESGDISSAFSHINHMYTGSLSEYYYARFDQAIELANLSSTDRVLEIGGGTGIFTLSLSKIVDEVYFSDIPRESPLFSTPKQLFDHTSLNDSNVRYVAADAAKLPFETSSFDVVFAMDVLEHVPDEEVAINEITRIVNQDGRVIISAPIEVGPPLFYRELFRFFDGKRTETQSLREFLRGTLGKPSTRSESGGHRGYDYRQTLKKINAGFDKASVQYCPLPVASWLNPTAIITAENNR